MKIKKHLFLFLMLNTIYCSAQNFKEDYKLSQNNYLNLKRFSCDVVVQMYQKINSAAPQQTMKTSIKKDDQLFLYTSDKTILLMNKNCMLNVYGHEKQIVYTVRPKQPQDKEMNDQLTGITDSILNRNDSIVYNGIYEGKKKYTVYANSAIIKKTEIYMDVQTHLFLKLVYYYGNGNGSFEKVVITYEKMDMAPSFSKDEFSEKKYVAFDGKQLKPVLAYSTYKTTVIDNASN